MTLMFDYLPLKLNLMSLLMNSLTMNHYCCHYCQWITGHSPHWNDRDYCVNQNLNGFHLNKSPMYMMLIMGLMMLMFAVDHPMLLNLFHFVRLRTFFHYPNWLTCPSQCYSINMYLNSFVNLSNDPLIDLIDDTYRRSIHMSQTIKCPTKKSPNFFSIFLKKIFENKRWIKFKTNTERTWS